MPPTFQKPKPPESILNPEPGTGDFTPDPDLGSGFGNDPLFPAPTPPTFPVPQPPSFSPDPGSDPFVPPANPSSEFDNDGTSNAGSDLSPITGGFPNMPPGQSIPVTGTPPGAKPGIVPGLDSPIKVKLPWFRNIEIQIQIDPGIKLPKIVPDPLHLEWQKPKPVIKFKGCW